jgi:predicted oxidoreductase (fatty acid repression mutant protein)
MPAFSPRLLGIKTWQEDMPATIPAFTSYADECYALISRDVWLRLTDDRCPAGVDGMALQSALSLVTA